MALEAIERARRGDGPTLIEAQTYRFRGHSLADPDELREKKEKEHWQVNMKHNSSIKTASKQSRHNKLDTCCSCVMLSLSMAGTSMRASETPSMAFSGFLCHVLMPRLNVGPVGAD